MIQHITGMHYIRLSNSGLYLLVNNVSIMRRRDITDWFLFFTHVLTLGLHHVLILTWHVESSYILQPPKYLLLFFNRFRYINNNITKDRCPIPMDTTVRLDPLRFSLRATIDHHGPSIHSGHYTGSINCCKKHSIATITQLRSLELLITNTLLLHMLYYMNWLTHDFGTRTGGWEFDRSHGAGTSSPSHWQQVEEQAPKPVGWMMCFLLMTLVPVQKLCVNVYIYICFPYMSSVILL